MWKYVLGVPFLVGVPTAAVGYKRRQEALKDPVLQRAMQHIRNDQRIIDFCGEEVRPGWIITKKVAPNNENWVKYDMNVQGLSGKLKTTVIGDYLQQGELEILEKERDEYYRNKAILEAEALKNTQKGDNEAQKKKAAEEYIPVDFDAYSIPDRSLADKANTIDQNLALSGSEKIWRISSLTTFVDADTKILLLPVPESKRKVKIQDTTYSLKTYGELLSKNKQIVSTLKELETRNVRFEDKTQEEISQDIKKKRRVQMTKLN